MPPRPFSADGSPRRVGVELEFAGPTCGEAAGLVQGLFGGRIEEIDAYRFAVADTWLGDFAVELDMSAAHPGRRSGAQAEDESLARQLEKGVRQAIGSIGGLWMPSEITFPPIPIEALAEVDRLVEALRGRGASGTRGSPIYAFGLHLNPEFAGGDADYLTDHIKAFLLLEPWLRLEGGIDASRRLSPFIDRFPAGYVRKLADPGYRPDLARLIDDFLEANPTRNRELDMLPAFAHLDRERVLRRVPDGRIKPRPTFHYRLPDSRVSAPHWGVVADWNRWVLVERLAADRRRLEGMGRDYLKQAPDAPPEDWAHQLWRWMP